MIITVTHNSSLIHHLPFPQRSFLGSDVPAPTTAEPHFTSLSTSSPHPPPPSTPAVINPVYKVYTLPDMLCPILYFPAMSLPMDQVSHDEGTQTNIGVPTPPHVHTSPPHSHTSLDRDGRESRVPNSERYNEKAVCLCLCCAKCHISTHTHSVECSGSML